MDWGFIISIVTKTVLAMQPFPLRRFCKALHIKVVCVFSWQTGKRNLHLGLKMFVFGAAWLVFLPVCPLLWSPAGEP